MKFQLGRGGDLCPLPPWLRLCSKWGKQKRCSQIFREVSCVFQRNFNCSKNSTVLEPRTGQFSRTWGFKAKTKEFKMCPRGRHLWLIYPKNLLVCGLLFCCHASLTPLQWYYFSQFGFMCGMWILFYGFDQNWKFWAFRQADKHSAIAKDGLNCPKALA